ncbi:SACOL1771 family peroxiredoxin [Staphylococcus intermedius]|uniref:OsmC/Ohr family protein n=1 Tax=Staphylococcus intermedius NCTC 11048 TaxID=1141106 RepID=A0A380G5P9_STAIN|nr:SACOL1771 family peroxiredoxin [Staphylococcus intermedius]PCF64654.1 peroxiredoxin [Staphylococcus intermedius]PCF80264.1 peroxiredoxin [Staphylococcus intermedius]PCF81614.1 peroxiredoxin [Staphylococcus intermedius]PCF87951.1 peroxiredoxin [Staphylococcus intermedius]PCF88664.1 peroxiredoxin [Staphylococcus intermedius]
MIEHQFPVQVTWQGGRNEVGEVQGDVIQHPVSIPASLGGIGTGTNPDELLVSAAASCMTISLAATLERAHLTARKIEMNSFGEAQFDQQKFKMKRIVHIPTIYVDDMTQQIQLEKRLPKLIATADNNCMISNSIRGNVAIEIHPTVIVATKN